MKVYGNGNWNRHIHRGKFNYAILNYVSVLALRLLKIGIKFILVRKRNVM